MRYIQWIIFVTLKISINKTQVLHFVEKPETFVSTLINAGAYLFTPEIFKILGDEFKRNYEEPNGYEMKNQMSFKWRTKCVLNEEPNEY